MRTSQRRLALATIVALMLLPASIGPASAGLETPAPQAAPDSYSVDEDMVLHVAAPGLLENDHPGPSSCVPWFDVTALEGEVEVSADGSFTYRPPADYNGDTEFSYAMQVDGGVDCPGPEDSQANVLLHVSAVNDPPTAKADSFHALAGRTFTVGAPGVLANDGDVDGDGLQAVKVNEPTHGVVTLAADGGFSYTPAAGYIGEDGFSYRASDGTDTSPVRFVTISVTAVPTAAPTSPPTPTPAPAPTPTPEVTPSAEPSPSPEESASIEPTAASSALPSTSPVPSASAEPSPVDSEGGGLSIPLVIAVLLVLSLLAFGGAFYVPRWLAGRSDAGEPPPEP